MLKDNAEEEKNEPNKLRRSTPTLPQFLWARSKKGSALVKYLRYQILYDTLQNCFNTCLP